MVGQWVPIHHCLIEESKGENELFVYIRPGFESLCNLISKQLTERTILPNNRKIIVWICFGAFWIFNEMSYGQIKYHFRNRVFTYTRWLFSHCIVFLPDAHGTMLFYCLLASA